MMFRWSLALLSLALLVCLTSTPAKAAPSNGLAIQGTHEVSKRHPDCYIELRVRWIICVPPIQIRILITLFCGRKRNTVGEDIVVVWEVLETNNIGFGAVATGDITLPDGQIQAETGDITLPGDGTTAFTLQYLDHDAVQYSEDCGVCASGKHDPHMKTFDRLSYTFNGHCSYVLSKDCSTTNPSFQINADFRGRNPDLPYEPPTRMVSFNLTTYGKQLLRINEDNSLMIKGKPMIGNTAIIGDNEGFVNIEDGRIMVDVKSPSISLNWDRRTHGMTVGLYESTLRGNVCGLLGDADGDKHNEFVKPSGERTFDAEEFGNSWEIPKSCP